MNRGFIVYGVVQRDVISQDYKMECDSCSARRAARSFDGSPIGIRLTGYNLLEYPAFNL